MIFNAAGRNEATISLADVLDRAFLRIIFRAPSIWWEAVAMTQVNPV